MNVLKLHRSGILLGFAALQLFVFATLGFAQDKIVGNTILATSPDTEYIIPDGMVPGSVYVTPCCECGCSECASPSHNGLRANLSATACFNCRTNGSYKFPVPR
ncbi:MAG: hypothetical protein IJK97_00065, partial [Thermoguttaceae bacterium]|nr:hypothetical protein [Thermoguttaceae bacterium]